MDPLTIGALFGQVAFTLAFFLTVHTYERNMRDLRAENRALLKTTLVNRGLVYVEPALERTPTPADPPEVFYDPEGFERLVKTKD